MLCALLPATASAQVPLPQLPVPLPPTQPPSQPPQRPPPAPPPPSSAGDAAVTTRIDPAHTGFAPTEDLFAPLKLRWSKHLGGGVVGAPIIADGRVFASTTRDTGTRTLRAFELESGKELWSKPVSSGVPWLAYADGRLFAPAGNGVAALNPADGAQIWTAAIDDAPDTNAVVAAAGLLFLPTRGVVALDAANGQQRWRTGEYSTGLAYSDGRVFVTRGCDEAYALRADNGQQIWRVSGDRCGYGYSIPSVHGGRVYRSGVAAIRSAADGAVVANGFPFTISAAFREDNAYVATQDGIQALPGLGGSPRWSYGTRKEWGTSELEMRRSSPVVTQHSVFALSPKGRLVVLDRATGALRESGTLKGTSGTYNGLGEEWQTSLAAAQGSLAVPVREWLHVLGSALAPPPDGADLFAYNPFPVFGKRVSLAAAAGRNVRSQEIQLQHDRFPFDRWSDGARKAPRAEGVAEFTFTPTRNTRFRARLASGALSREVTAWVYPAVNFRFASAGPRNARVNFSVRGPSDIRLGGRRIFLYLNRAKTTRLTRLASATLRGTGRGRARASGIFRRLNRLGRKDYFYYCIKGIESQGFGVKDRFAKTCGARSTRF